MEKKKGTNSTGKKFKKILSDDQKQTNVYQSNDFTEKRLRVHDFVFDFDLIFISLGEY